MQAEKRIPQGSNVAPLDPFEAVESALREATGTELPESIWPELRAAFEREQARKTRQSRQQLAQRPLVALTSLSPDPAQFKQQQRAIRSWVAAGLCPISFNHRSELAALSAYRDVEFVCVERTSLTEFGRHYVPISEMCEFANNCTGHVLIINADIVLTCDAWKLRRAAFLAEAGLCYLIRHNHTGNLSRAKAEPYGIDGFLFHARHSQLIERSFLSMGKPFWDYWLPHAFSAKGLTVYTLEEAIAFHENHTQRWSDEDWHQCALEFDRLTGLLGADRSLSACTAMALKVRSSFDEHRALIPRAPTPIRDWVERRFSDHTPKTFFELGAHQGTDTVWLAALPGVVVHAFEPDPRNHPPHLPNVHLVRAAVSLEDGRTQLIPSLNGWNREWTYSSSIKRPANHLTRYPVTFGDPIEVATVSLDSYARKHAIGPVDFIWADIQGAERELILGAKELLSRTRYLYTEYSDDTMYEGQPTLREILALLPNFRVLELYEDDVLLENTAWVG